MFRRDKVSTLRNKLRSITGKVSPCIIGSFAGNGSKFFFLETKYYLQEEKLKEERKIVKIGFYFICNQ